MIFKETHLKDALIVSIEKREDPRGFFARAWCSRELEGHGLRTNFVQANISQNHKKGTLRGMHYQLAPHEEVKLVRCTRGAIYDAIIDLRPDSPTYKHWVGVELTAESRDMLYVPEGFGHGFQVLQDDSEVFYEVTQFYHPEAERGVRYDDSSFGITWPLQVTEISEKDNGWPKFS
ncbi:MAG: dTDP-4-dehydrorhamnose 3,5-epimerase [Nitrospirales bacterium]|nr:MAG: dTDP-4-dehydrorhamnose 3,5-epimerase [Nitrospirales bacterium]